MKVSDEILGKEIDYADVPKTFVTFRYYAEAVEMYKHWLSVDLTQDNAL